MSGNEAFCANLSKLEEAIQMQNNPDVQSDEYPNSVMPAKNIFSWQSAPIMSLFPSINPNLYII